MPPVRARITYLDGLRGFAVLPVLGLHWVNPFHPLCTGGYIGVDIFFVLSGFLITGILAERRIGYSQFMAKRVRRLYPALLAMLVIGTLAMLVVAGPLFGGVAAGNGVIAALQMSSLWMPAIGDLDPFNATWSLSVEWYFYLLWPPAVFALARRPPAAAARILAAMAAAFWLVSLPLPAVWFYYGPTSRFAELCLGGAAAFWARGGLPTVRASSRWLLAFGTIAVAGWAVTGTTELTWPFRFLVLPGVAIWTAAVALTGPVGHLAFLQWIPLVAIGRVSYSLYIWHPLALALLHFTPLHGSGWALIEIGVPGTMTMTLLSYYLLEKPYTHPRAITRPAGARSSSDGAGGSSASRHLHERRSHHGAGQ